MPGRKFGFDTSTSLKQLLAEHFEEWKATHGGDLDDLAEKCGVTPAYLSHVRRYGRIPSRPVLILLAFNFKIPGEKLFRASGIEDKYPYETGLEIAKSASQGDGLFSIKFNMEAFTDSIRSIVRSEVRSRSFKDLLGNRPLRIGVNYHQYWLFNSQNAPADGKHTGLFPEFCTMLGLALQKEVELVHIPFSNYINLITSGQLDLFGPTLAVPNLPDDILFSAPIFRLGVSALYRKNQHRDLPAVTAPRSVDDLRNEKYVVAVLKDSLPHLIANTLLKRADSSLLLVSSDEEGIERVTMKGVHRPAHVFMMNSISALLAAKKHPKDVEPLFTTRKTLLDLADNSIAIRPDWPEVVPVINDAIRFLQARGGLEERLTNLYSGDMAEVIAF